MFGIPPESYGTPMQIASLFQDLSLTNIPTLLVSLSVIGVIVLSERASNKFPGALLAIFGAIVSSWVLGLSSYEVAILGTMPGGLPHLSFPQVPLSNIPKILNLSVVCFIVILAQSAATSRAYAMKFSDTFNENVDISHRIELC